MKKLTVTLKLKKAKAGDLLEFDSYNESGKKKWKIKTGVPYWLVNSKGKIEKHTYRTSENMDSVQLGDYLKREQILIYKGKYK